MPMTRNVYPSTSGPSASGRITVVMIFQRETPMDRAASITPGSTVMRFCSTMRATANVAPMVMVKIAALDPETTQEVLGLLKRVNRELGITIVLITHEMDVVRATADRVAVMDSGRVVETGTTAEVFAHPRAQTTRKFVSSVTRTVPRADEIEKLRREHPGRLVLVDVTDQNRIGDVLSDAARNGVSFNIAFGGISILQSQSFGTLTLSLTGSDESVDRAVESLRAVTTVREVSE